LITFGYLYLRDTLLQYWLYIFSISFSLSLIQIRLSILRAQSKSVRFALLAILSTGFPLLVVTNIAINNYQNTFLAFAIAILFVAFTVQFRFIFSFPKYTNYLSLFKLISVGYPMIFHSVSISLFQYGDKLSGYFGLGAEIVSQIVIMSIFMTAPVLLLSTINNAWLPAVLEHFYKSEKDGYAFSNKVALKLNWLITLISLGIMIMANQLVKIFTPITYDRQAITNSIIIGIIASPLYILYLQNTHLITIHKEFKKLATITPVAAAVQFTFTFGLVGEIGLLAPALGFIFALLIQVILTSFATRKINKLNITPIYSTIFFRVFILHFVSFMIGIININNYRKK
jgi:O-antigen/teichoic acid export membrane protein